MSIRNCYGRYLDGLRFEVEHFSNENYNVTWKGEGEQPNYPDLTTFFNIWRRDFGHIKVSRSIEDICEQCFKFANRHHFMKINDVTSAADDVLFTDDPEDGNGDKQEVGDDTPLPDDLEERYDSDEEDEAGEDDSFEEKPPSAQNPPKPTPNEEGEDVIEDDSEDGEETAEQKAMTVNQQIICMLMCTMRELGRKVQTMLCLL
jgi:hypothetical protein